MPAISATGVGSGLDINDLVSQLVATEREPTEKRLDVREAESQAKLSAFGVLKGALADFQDSLSALKDPDSFQNRTATSSDETLFTATTSSDALLGTYRLEVTRLAQHHKLLSEGFADTQVEIGTGSLTVSVGESAFEVAIGEGEKTLAGIQRAINDAPGNDGVTASIIQVDGLAGEPVAKLMLSADETGNANKLSVAVVDADGNSTDVQGLSRLLFEPAGIQHLSQVQQPPDDDLDAQIKLDGQTVSSASNTVSGVIPGVDINLLAAAPEEGRIAQLVVALDGAGTKLAIDDFVSNFNALVDTFNDLSSYNAESGETAVLFADATLRGLSTHLRRALNDSAQSVASRQNSLTAIGISTDRSGKLIVDEEQLSASLETNLAGLGALFTGENGIAERLDGVIAGYLDTAGAIDVRVEGLNSRIEDIAAQRGTLDKRLEALEQRLRVQFTAMDALVSQLNSTGDYLTEQFRSLQAMVGGRNR
ncbi:MAG: flagellar filament capping protein FliD [Gammaproteobacteria bacterium]